MGNGGYGGGLTAGTGQSIYQTGYSYGYSINYGGTTNEGGKTIAYSGDGSSSNELTPNKGAFGYAQSIPGNNVPSGGQHTQAAGGGGWYGGGGGYHCGGGGGSSFIIGHNGCNPVNMSTGTHLGTTIKKITYNGADYTFTSTIMIDGSGCVWTTAKGNAEQMPTPNGGKESLNDGHSGDGYAKITSL